MMVASFGILPEFTRFQSTYPRWVLAGCWSFATFGAIIPVFIKQRFPSNRFWYVFVSVTTVGTWSGFWMLYTWCENEARRSPQFPGLGPAIFLAEASLLSGGIAFLLGLIFPRNPTDRATQKN
ncbi:MAG: hypothetical protein U0905_13830 [Pirellulales bacterium]